MTNFDRHLRLPGTINFRDMGGYSTKDGGHVAHGRLFRSGHMANLHEEALPRISALNISLVCDFRNDYEREQYPSRYYDNHLPVIETLPVWPDKSPKAHDAAQELLSGKISAKEAPDFLGLCYREFVRDQSKQFANLFSAVLADNHPVVLLHCSAGKDRTGIGSALLLSVLGVSRADVVADYMLSLYGHGAYIQTMQYVEQSWIKFKGGNPACSRGDIFTLFSAHPSKIAAAFDEMEKVGGSVDGYICDVLGVTDSARIELQRRYLTRG
ncbi:MAG: tyrosine-protein phosphatase [Rhodospirillaceae bacterium]